MNSIKYLPFLILFLAFHFSVSAESIYTFNPNYAVSNIPDSLVVKAHTVIRLSEETFVVENIGKAKESIKMVITILDDKSKQDELRVYYDQFTKVGKIKARLYDKDGKKIRDISRAEVNDYAAYDGFSIYNDLRLKHVDFIYGNYPYTIEYEYEVQHNGLQSYATWTPQRPKTSIEQSNFTLKLPDNMNFRYKAFNVSNKPNINSDGDAKIYAWALQYKKVVVEEDHTPDTYQPYPIVYTLPNDFEVDGHKGNMENWQSFGKFMYELNANRDRLSTGMVQKIKSLTANATSNQEKIEILYKYLQENMRYVSVQLGIGGWQTFDAEYVEKNKYGDCKALTNFMKGMLNTVGIKSYAALIRAGSQSFEIKEEFTVPYFNHVILNVPEEEIWLECTSTNNPVNYLGTNTQNRPTLLVTEKGGVLTKTPAITDNIQIGKTTIDLKGDGSATINCSTKLTGQLHESIRYLSNNYSQKEQEKWFKRIQNFPTFEIETLDLSSATDLPEADCNYSIKVNRYASKAGKRLFVPVNLVNQMGRSLPKDADRSQPVAFELGYQDADEITFKIPSDYKVESLPKNAAPISTPYGIYEVTIEEKENTIVYKRNLIVHPIEVPASKYKELRDFYKKISKLDGTKIVLVKRPA